VLEQPFAGQPKERARRAVCVDVTSAVVGDEHRVDRAVKDSAQKLLVRP
jgi:hypothetical protein